MQVEEEWGQEFGGLVLGYDQNVLLDNIFIQLQNRLLYCHQPFLFATSVEHVGLNCKVEYTNANQGIVPKFLNIWVQFIVCKENDLDYIFQGEVASFPVLSFGMLPPS